MTIILSTNMKSLEEFCSECKLMRSSQLRNNMHGMLKISWKIEICSFWNWQNASKNLSEEEDWFKGYAEQLLTLKAQIPQKWSSTQSTSAYISVRFFKNFCCLITFLSIMITIFCSFANLLFATCRFDLLLLKHSIGCSTKTYRPKCFWEFITSCPEGASHKY